MKKKILGLLLALCLIISMLPMAVLADSDAETIRFYFLKQGSLLDSWVEAADGYTPALSMNPGDVAYFTTEKTDASNPNNYYLKDATANDAWNVKIEYPTTGSPVMTLKGAKIHNDLGLIYGMRNALLSSDLKIVVEEDSEICQTNENSINCNMILGTTGTVTITGPGKLTSKSNCSVGTFAAYGDLVFDNANISMTDTNGDPKGYFITVEGNLLVKGGTLDMFTYTTNDGWPFGCVTNIILTKNGGNVTIQDGAKVTAIGSICDNAGNTGFVNASGKFTIKDSEVTFAPCGGYFGNVFKNAPVLEGVIATASVDAATYDPESGTLTEPTLKAFKEKSAIAYWYFKTVPGTATDTDTDTNTDTNTSTNTNTNTNTNTGTTTNPATGDNTNLVMLFSLLAVSALGLTSVLVFKKKIA